MSVTTDPLVIIVMELDQCSKTFPECGAPEPCSNAYELPGTWNTCSNKCLFECQVNRYVFSTCNIPYHLRAEIDSYNFSPSITSCSHVPVQLNFGQSFSRTGNFSFTLSGVKKCNDPFGGTEIQRLIKAQKYMENRRITVHSGHSGMSLCEFNKEIFYISSVSGPSGKECSFTFKAVDPLDLADKSTCPSSNPYLNTDGDQVELTLGINLDGVPSDDEPDAQPFSGVGKLLLSSSLDITGDQRTALMQTEYLCVGGELLRVTPELNNLIPQGLSFRLEDRAQCGSTLGPHSIGDKVKIPTVFQAETHIADVICRLLEECASLRRAVLLCCTDDPIEIVDRQSLENYRCKKPLHVLTQDVIVCDATAVKVLRDELQKTFALNIYYDSLSTSIKVTPIAGISEEPEVLEQWHVIDSSESIRNNGNYATSVIFNHTVDDWTKKPVDDNLIDATGFVSADSLRDECDRREYAVDSSEVVDTRWINQGSEYLAYSNARVWQKMLSCPLDTMCVRMMTDEAQRFQINKPAVLRIEKNLSWTGEYSDDLWIVESRKVVNKGECMEICFVKSPYQDTVDCLSCEFLFPPQIDDCGSTCFEIA